MLTILNQRRARFAVLAALTLVLSGCGGGDVTGKVTFRGSPATGGWVTFTYQGGQHAPVSGIIHPDGTYRIDGCPAGAARVTVRLAAAPTKKTNGPKTPSVPVRYSDPEKTDLVVTVAGGEQQFDLDLQP